MGYRSLQLPERYEAVKRDKEPDVLRPYIRRRNHRHRSGFSSTVKLSCVSLMLRHSPPLRRKRSACNLRNIRRYLVGRFACKRSCPHCPPDDWLGSIVCFGNFTTVRTRRDLRSSFGACVQSSVSEYVCRKVVFFFYLSVFTL